MSDELLNHKTKCRLCFGRVSVSQSLKISNETQEKFLSLTKVELILSAELSNFSCESCITSLESCSAFQQRMVENQQKLYFLTRQADENKTVDDRRFVQCIKTEPRENIQTEFIEEMLMNVKTEYFEDNIAIDRLQLSENIKTAREKSLRPKRDPKAGEITAKAEKLSDGFVRCRYCSKLLQKRSIWRHIHLHENKLKNITFDCDLCEYKANVKKGLISHMEFKHIKDPNKNVKIFKCSFCPKVSQSADSMRIHERYTHKAIVGQHPCETCGKIYLKEHLLHRHSLIVHQTGEFLCKICKEVFKTRGFLHSHKQKHQQTIACEVCGKLIFRGGKYSSHMLSHGPPELKCTVEGCSKVYYRKKSLEYHHENEHAPKKSFKCPKCESTFPTTAKVKRHLDRQHSNVKWTCLVTGCNHSTNRKEYLVLHINNHRDLDVDFRTTLLTQLKRKKS